MNFEQAITSSNYLYSRARSWRADGSVQSDADYIVSAYGRAHDGIVVQIGSINGLDQAIKILDRHGKVAPLSPTEGLRK